MLSKTLFFKIFIVHLNFFLSLLINADNISMAISFFIFFLKFWEASHIGKHFCTFRSHFVSHDPFQDTLWKFLKGLIGGSKECEVTISSKGFQYIRCDGCCLKHNCAFQMLAHYKSKRKLQVTQPKLTRMSSFYRKPWKFTLYTLQKHYSTFWHTNYVLSIFFQTMSIKMTILPLFVLLQQYPAVQKITKKYTF